jgi:hypothetical protein
VNRGLAHAFAWLLWWAILFWFWMLLVGEWNQIEFVAAACAATIGASLGEFARAKAGIRARVPLAWIARAWSVPFAIFADFGLLVWLLLRAATGHGVPRGYFRSQAFATGGDDPVSVGIRTWATVTATYSPNSLVVEIEPDRQLVLFPALFPWKQSRSPAG